MKSSSPTDLKRRRERILLLFVLVLITIFTLIEFRLAQFINPLSTYKNLLVFTIININLLLILVLSFLVIRHLVKVFFEERANVLGARLKTRLIMGFIFISLLPTTLLFFISYQFLQTSLAYWFDEKIESSLERAITVGRNYYREQVDQLKGVNRAISENLARSCISPSGHLDQECVENIIDPPFGVGASCIFAIASVHAIDIYDLGGRTIYSKIWLPLTEGLSPPELVEKGLSEETTGKSDEEETVEISTLEQGSGSIVRVVSVIRDSKGVPAAFVSTAKLVPGSTLNELDAIKEGYEEYKQLKLFQDPLKSTLLATLFLITLLIIFVSIWFAVKLANGITQPLQMLADATQRVAQGDLDFELKAEGRDELQALVTAFNTMMADLKEARAKAERASRRMLNSYRELENRNRYIEMLLENITAGVISLDRTGKITTINRAASEILKIDPNNLIGRHYTQLLGEEVLGEFEAIRNELLSDGTESLKRPLKMEIEGVSRSLLVNFSILRDQSGRISGILIVFDDLTDLERIQRIAAWRDVARRIAHEVKNPLTPIKLSAQRLRRKIAGALDGERRTVLERCTDTIINQADELKRLVDEFSRFARMPAPVFKDTSVEEIIAETTALYQDAPVRIRTLIEPGLPRLRVDPEQIKRVIINIIDNAMAALSGGEIELRAKKASGGKIRIEIADWGPGVAPEDMSRLFEPYFTKKKGGTGLGLAIAKSIVEAHDGTIGVQRNSPNGLVFTIELKTV